MMMDLSAEDERSMRLAYSAVDACNLKTKDIKKIKERMGFLTVDAAKKRIDELLRENYIKEGENRYVLTETGKNEKERWETIGKENIMYG